MTATLSVENILTAVEQMNVMQVMELVKAMEEKFGVSAQAVAAVAPAAAGAPAAAAEEKTEFNVILAHAGENKINVIKAVRTITSLGLKEAKDLVEGAPSTLKEAVSKDEAEKIKKQIEEAGGRAEIK